MKFHTLNSNIKNRIFLITKGKVKISNLAKIELTKNLILDCLG